MDLTPDQRMILSFGVLGFALVLQLTFIIRSILLKKIIGTSMLKYYTGIVVFAVIGSLGMAGVLDGSALAGLLGTAAGYAIGSRGSSKDSEAT